jgi:hypothetical protein
MQTPNLKLEAGFVGGLKPIADLWRVKVYRNPSTTIRAIQAAMIDYEISVGNMCRNLIVQAWIVVEMRCIPGLKRTENIAKFAKLAAEAKLPLKCIERASKPRVRNGKVVWRFWSKGFAADLVDRIHFLDGYKEDPFFDAESYPDVFPALPSGLEYGPCNLKVGAHRG